MAGRPTVISMADAQWRVAAPIRTARPVLEPLRVDHATKLAPLLDDPELHRLIGGQPATLDELENRFTRMAVGHSADGTQGWLNWGVRQQDSGAAIGTVQATLLHEDNGTLAEIAWVVARPYQALGSATEASAGMVGWLRDQGVDRLIAHIHPDHDASAGVARRLGLAATELIEDGEVRWSS